MDDFILSTTGFRSHKDQQNQLLIFQPPTTQLIYQPAQITGKTRPKFTPRAIHPYLPEVMMIPPLWGDATHKNRRRSKNPPSMPDLSAATDYATWKLQINNTPPTMTMMSSTPSVGEFE